MAIEIIDEGIINRILAPSGFLSEQQGKIIFRGDNNTLAVGNKSAMRGGQIQIWNEISVSIGDDCLLGFIDIFANRGAVVVVRDKVGFTGTVKLHAHEAATLRIGDGCLIAKDTLITVSDMHSIIDVETGTRINPARNVTIGERVWLAEGVRVMKGSSIGDGTIIGACSMVTGSIPPNCLAVGVPASVMRDGVTWRHDLI